MKLIGTNQYFREAFKIDPTVKIFWSETFELHYLVTKRPLQGYLFENGTFISYGRAVRDLLGMTVDYVKCYFAGLTVFEPKNFIGLQ